MSTKHPTGLSQASKQFAKSSLTLILAVFLLSQFFRISLHVVQRSLFSAPGHSWLLPAHRWIGQTLIHHWYTEINHCSLLLWIIAIIIVDDEMRYYPCYLPDWFDICEARLGDREWPEAGAVDWAAVATLRQLRLLVSHSINLDIKPSYVVTRQQCLSDINYYYGYTHKPVCFLKLL